jgi:hypothetical protein
MAYLEISKILETFEQSNYKKPRLYNEDCRKKIPVFVSVEGISCWEK